MHSATNLRSFVSKGRRISFALPKSRSRQFSQCRSRALRVLEMRAPKPCYGRRAQPGRGVFRARRLGHFQFCRGPADRSQPRQVHAGSKCRWAWARWPRSWEWISSKSQLSAQTLPKAKSALPPISIRLNKSSSLATLRQSSALRNWLTSVAPSAPSCCSERSLPLFADEKPAQDRLEADLSTIKMQKKPVYPVACNVDAEFADDDPARTGHAGPPGHGIG